MDNDIRIAITGGSSTGKTTLLRALAADRQFRRHVPHVVVEGARELLLRTTRRRSMDEMSRDDFRAFQRAYFAWKEGAEEDLRSFVADRSFVDVAATWLERDTFDAPALQDELISPCRAYASRYTLHIFLPSGVLHYEADGLRESNGALHERIGTRIAAYLSEWKLPTLTITSTELGERVETVKRALNIM